MTRKLQGVFQAYLKEKESNNMSLQGYLLGLKISTLFAFSAWAGVVLYIDPDVSGVFGKSLFFITFFLWLAGMLTLGLTGLQKKIVGDERAAGLLGANMRQSIFVSCLIVAFLVLQSFKVLAFWNGLLIGVALLLIELYFIHRAVKGDDTQKAKLNVKQQQSRLKQRKLI